jgi:phosphomevalonate kinase
MLKTKVYLFSGKARSGKDTACEYFKTLLEKDNKSVAHTLYAKYIKGYAIDFFGWNGSEETKPREFLQRIGTDVIRKRLNKPNFHADRICEDIEILSDYFDAFLISDVRFPNEVLIPKEKFGKDAVTIRIIRTNFESDLTPEQQAHESETALDDFKGFDYVIKASNLEELYTQLNEIYIKEEGSEI